MGRCIAGTSSSCLSKGGPLYRIGSSIGRIPSFPCTGRAGGRTLSSGSTAGTRRPSPIFRILEGSRPLPSSSPLPRLLPPVLGALPLGWMSSSQSPGDPVSLRSLATRTLRSIAPGRGPYSPPVSSRLPLSGASYRRPIFGLRRWLPGRSVVLL